MAAVRGALDLILAGYEPYPALVIDRGWNLVATNASVALFTDGAAAELVQPPVNVLRLGALSTPLTTPAWQCRYGCGPGSRNFGTAVDITVAELSIEAFLPADDVTARWLRDAQLAKNERETHGGLDT